ncbi:MAG: dihydrofolate reductase [Proteobacteria bacterium]|nr:dihydrofolate reductase [Pseudomonadota bacterium]
MEIVLVVAMAENRVIGRQGGLPWHISGDLKHFKRLTMGHPVIMGRKTWASIGKALPGRRNIVVTRNADFHAEGAEAAMSIGDGLSLIPAAGGETAMVIGGGEIYAQAMGRASRIELTEVHMTIDGDTMFPNIDPALWMETARQRNEPETPGGPAYSFVTLIRR